MSRRFSDGELEQVTARLHAAVQTWAERRDLWRDCGFQSFARRVKAEPVPPATVSILWYDGSLVGVLSDYEDDELYDEFHAVVHAAGFEFQPYDRISGHFYALDPDLQAAFDDYAHWQWVCSLVEPDCADVYHELYGHFAKRPDDLLKLSWREFEVLLFRIFQNQGFSAELGPGRGDGGVDIRLLQRDPIGDVLTLVQAKRYAPDRKIDLQAVAALHGVATLEKASRSLFVTTSSYLPVAHRFAGRTDGAMALATSADVVEWCGKAERGVLADKSGLVSRASVSRLLDVVARTRDPRVVYATFGYNTVRNAFALVIKETNHAALLMRLPALTLSDDGYGQRGFEVPRLDASALAEHRPDTVWRALRSVQDGRATYWDGDRLYSPWDGEPRNFDYCD